MKRWVTVLTCACLFALPNGALRAQRAAMPADSLVQHGLLDRAEAAYYSAARARPRDPVARWNLGRYLIERGAARVGMTLVEEAVQFGFDKTRADSVLAPVYLELGEYQKLLALAPSPLNAAERERVRFLAAHPSRIIAPDSSIAAAYLPATTGEMIGTIAIRIDGRPVTARIVNGGPPLQVAAASAAAKRLRTFGTTSSVAVADSIGISRLLTTNVPVEVSTMLSGDAQVSLEFLARYAPTFDPRAGRVTLRASGEANGAPAGANVFLTMINDDQLRILKAGGWTTPADPEILRLLNAHRWTIDRRRGTIVVEP